MLWPRTRHLSKSRATTPRIATLASAHRNLHFACLAWSDVRLRRLVPSHLLHDAMHLGQSGGLLFVRFWSGASASGWTKAAEIPGVLSYRDENVGHKSNIHMSS